MSVISGYIPRARMSAQERRWRSELNQLIRSVAFARGSMVFRERACGNKGCKCARGEKHPGVYLDINEDGRHWQIFIPTSRVEEVQCWTAQYKKIRELLENLSRIYWDKLRKREG